MTAQPIASLRAVCYTRKSTTDTGGEGTKSVERQVREATEYISSRGWEFVEPFVDNEISAIDWHKRIAWNRLFTAATTQRPRPFDVVVVWAQDRIGWDAQGLVAITDLEQAGVALWAYGTG